MTGELDPLRDLVKELNDQSDKRSPRPSGGAKSVGPEDTITLGGCWCGRLMDHDWTGKDDGAPHPRYPD